MSSTYKLQKTNRLHVMTGLQVTTSLERLKTSLEAIHTRHEVTRKSRLSGGGGGGGQSLGREQESERVGEISNMFDISPTLPDRPGTYNRP